MGWNAHTVSERGEEKHVGRYILKGWCLFRNSSRFSQVLSMAHIPTSVPWECEFHQDRDFCLLCRQVHFWYPRTVPHSLQSLSQVRLFVTPWTATHQASLSITNWMANHFSILALRTPWTVWKHSGWLVKNPPAMRETWVQSLGWEDPLEKGKATHSCILAWRIPWTSPWGHKGLDVTEWLSLSRHSKSSINVCWRKGMNIYFTGKVPEFFIK